MKSACCEGARFESRCSPLVTTRHFGCRVCSELPAKMRANRLHTRQPSSAQSIGGDNLANFINNFEERPSLIRQMLIVVTI